MKTSDPLSHSPRSIPGSLPFPALRSPAHHLTHGGFCLSTEAGIAVCFVLSCIPCAQHSAWSIIGAQQTCVDELNEQLYELLADKDTEFPQGR